MTLGVLLALGAALAWGSGDFCGGRASLRRDSVQVMAVAAVSGIAILFASAVLVREPVAGLQWLGAAVCLGAVVLIAA